MANVIIIRPISDRSWSPKELYKRALTIPHGPLTLAAHLINKGFSTDIIDEIALQETEVTEHTKVIVDRISLKAQNQLFNEIKKEKPVCVGITSMTGEQIRRGKIFSSLIRKADPKIPIVWGGAHPSLLPEMTIEDDKVDIVCIGEGDKSFPILVSELKKNGTNDLSKVPGIIYRDKDGNIQRTKLLPLYNLTNMPKFPYHLLDMEMYINNIKKDRIKRFFEIHSSRGCPYKCTFCINSVEDIPYTRSSSSRLLEEIITLKNEYNIDGISFNDDNFILDKRRMKEISEAAIKLKLNLRFRASGTIKLFLKFDDENLALYKKAGFYHFGFGVESGSDRILKDIRKAGDLTKKEIYQVVDSIKKHQFQATYNFMAGFPTETLEEYKETLRVIYHIFENSTHAIYPLPAPSIFMPLPGTVSYDSVVKLGHKAPKSLDEWSVIDHNHNMMTWISKDFYKFIAESREIINSINQK